MTPNVRSNINYYKGQPPDYRFLPLYTADLVYTADLDEIHEILPFNFSLLEVAWHARTLANLIDDYEAVLPE
jgi:alpha-glucosidase